MKRVILSFSACFLFGLLCLWPLLSAGLHTDDWGWLALAHMLDNPLASYTKNILWGYFYRPSAMVFWWMTERLAGDQSAWHYLINVALHSASASCLALLLRAAGRPVWLSAGVGLLYVCCPAIAGTSLWLSSRNEMLALFAGLCSMLFLEHEIRKQRFHGFAISVFLFIALTAKESAYLFPFACACRVFFDFELRRSLKRRKAVLIIFYLFVPLVLSASLRSITIIPIGPEANAASLFETLRVGITHWFRVWPSAISGFDAGRIYWIYFSVISATALLALSTIYANGKTRAWGLAALLLVFAPGALQAPITATVLSQASAIDFPENLRFYATSSLGVLLLIGMCMPITSFKWYSGIALSSLLFIGGLTSFNLAAAWRDNTQTDDRQARRLAVLIPALMTKTPCQGLNRIMIKADVMPSIAPWIDPALKAQWPRAANIQHCSFFVESQQSYYQILPLIDCDKTNWSADTYRQFSSKASLMPLDSVCQTSMLPPNETNANAIIELPFLGH